MAKVKKSTFPLRLTQAQRCSVAKLLARLKPHLLLDCSNQRTLQFGLEEIKDIAGACRAAIAKAPTFTCGRDQRRNARSIEPSRSPARNRVLKSMPGS